MKFFPSLEGPRKGASIHVPQKRGPYGNKRPFPEPYLTLGLLTSYIYEGRSEINASYFIMLAHDVGGECC